jgi:Spy/CpxP family protein refolding chaperone
MASAFSKTLIALGAFTLGAATFTASDAAARPPRDRAEPSARGDDDADRGRHGHRPGGKAMRLAHAVGRLDLTADQQAALDQIMAEMEADRPDRGGRTGDRRGRMEAILDGEVSSADLHAEVDARAAAHAARAHDDVDRVLEIVSLLTPAQKEALKAQLAERAERRGERGGRGGGPREGSGKGRGHGKRAR